MIIRGLELKRLRMPKNYDHSLHFAFLRTCHAFAVCVGSSQRGSLEAALTSIDLSTLFL